MWCVNLQHGVIAGGLADGSIALWDAQQILRGRSDSSQLAKETKHHGAVSLCLRCRSLLSFTTALLLHLCTRLILLPHCCHRASLSLMHDTCAAGQGFSIQPAQPQSVSLRWR